MSATKKNAAWLALLLPALALAAGQDLGALQREAQRFVDTEGRKSGQSWQVGKPDARLALPACDRLEFAWRDSGRGRVEASCPALGWSLTLPVEQAAAGKVYVTTRQIGVGEVISAADIRLESVDNALLRRQGVSDPAQLIGREARSVVPAGSVARPALLRAPQLVKLRQPVKVVVGNGDFSVSAEGVSLGNAAVGEGVIVRMPSGKQVQGVVAADGTVLVPMQ